jgi:hypothetical protein
MTRCQGEHVPPYQRVNIPVELVVYQREPQISCREPIRMPGEGILRPVDTCNEVNGLTECPLCNEAFPRM